MRDYEFNEDRIKDLTNETEITSAIATIVYEVENAKYNGAINKDIDLQIQELQKNSFPSNLKLNGIEYDPDTSFCAAAFQDTDTGLVTVGTAGTNLDNGLAGHSLASRNNVILGMANNMPTKRIVHERRNAWLKL